MRHSLGSNSAASLPAVAILDSHIRHEWTSESLMALAVETKHTRICSLVVSTSDLCGSVLVPVYDYYGWSNTGRAYVVPIEGPTSPSVRSNEGVLDFAREGGEIAELFGDFCRQNLCMESWDFLVDSVAYKVYRSAPL